MPPTDLKRTARSLWRGMFEAVALRRTAGEPLVPPARLHSVGDSDFRATGDEFLGLFTQLAGLRSDERVLDVGCGIGRLARPLTGHLGGSGSYDGFDVSKIAIKWCQRHYGADHPNFRFKHVNVVNGEYNPAGGVPAERFSFPYADASFDFVFLTSVFTHMLPAGVERYVDEIARVLVPGGRCLITFFLLNSESRMSIEQGRSSQPFVDAQPPYAVINPANPEAAVAYDEEWAVGRLVRSELQPRTPVSYGSWCGREVFTSYQDIVVADRTEQPLQ